MRSSYSYTTEISGYDEEMSNYKKYLRNSSIMIAVIFFTAIYSGHGINTRAIVYTILLFSSPFIISIVILSYLILKKKKQIELLIPLKIESEQIEDKILFEKKREEDRIQKIREDLEKKEKDRRAKEHAEEERKRVIEFLLTDPLYKKFKKIWFILSENTIYSVGLLYR